MTELKAYLAVYLGSPDSPAMARWAALSEDERTQRRSEGVAQWNAWGAAHADPIVVIGGPLGATLRVDDAGVTAAHNALAAYTVVRAPSHEAAAAMFENHPHLTVFPGDRIEVMPVLPVPGSA